MNICLIRRYYELHIYPMLFKKDTKISLDYPFKVTQRRANMTQKWRASHIHSYSYRIVIESYCDSVIDDSVTQWRMAIDRCILAYSMVKSYWKIYLSIIIENRILKNLYM
jgi:ribonucleotide reductase beta subunit family protein with ferritin-like domain